MMVLVTQSHSLRVRAAPVPGGDSHMPVNGWKALLPLKAKKQALHVLAISTSKKPRNTTKVKNKQTKILSFYIVVFSRAG